MTIDKTNFQPCGECTACCTWLHGVAHGVPFGGGKSCVFLNKNCTVYSVRPQFCRHFFCAFSQNLFPQEWMRPDKCGALVMVQDWSKGQYLKIVETGRKMTDEALLEITNFCKKHNTPYMLQYDGQWSIHGPDIFVEEVKNK